MKSSVEIITNKLLLKKAIEQGIKIDLKDIIDVLVKENRRLKRIITQLQKRKK